MNVLLILKIGSEVIERTASKMITPLKLAPFSKQFLLFVMQQQPSLVLIDSK
jgi:hypothetical protein